jgi:hypothetical protein
MNFALVQHTPNLFTQYQEMLSQQAIFDDSLNEFLAGSQTGKLNSMLLLLQTVFEVLLELGLKNHYNVYWGVKNKVQNNFERICVWQTCHISGIVSSECLAVARDVSVDRQYLKWLQCLWLTTHVREQEHVRTTYTQNSEVTPEHKMIYRMAMLFVLEQTKELYESALKRAVKPL